MIRKDPKVETSKYRHKDTYTCEEKGRKGKREKETERAREGDGERENYASKSKSKGKRQAQPSGVYEELHRSLEWGFFSDYENAHC